VKLVSDEFKEIMPEHNPGKAMESIGCALVSTNIPAAEAVLSYMLKIMPPLNAVFEAWRKKPGNEAVLEEYGVKNIEGFLGKLQDNLLAQLITEQEFEMSVTKRHTQKVTEDILAALKVAYEGGFSGQLDLGYDRSTSTALDMEVTWSYRAKTGKSEWLGWSKEINSIPGDLGLLLGQKWEELRDAVVTPATEPKPK